jgi:hypothetical protein
VKHVPAPRLFEEGACSVAAAQGAQRLPLFEAGQRLRGQNWREAFASDPEAAYALAHACVERLEAANGPQLVARVLARAAADGLAGAVERALIAETGHTLEGLWDVVTADIGAGGSS